MSSPPPVPPAEEAGVVHLDAEHPWPGLVPYREEHAPFFFGRDEEAEELFARVTQKTFTLLFGQSGLGKTSLLNACLYPRLRAAGLVPVDLRLDFKSAEPFEGQVLRQLAGIIARELPATPLPESGESIWFWFHRVDVTFRMPDGRKAVPVLVFDQFEEFFTLGAETEEGRTRSEQFLGELADLAENRLPAKLGEALEREPALSRRLVFGRSDYRVLVSMREDYVAHLDSLASRMRSVGENRMRLVQMNGVQALQAVNNPGAQVITPAVSRQIVRFVAATRHGRSAQANGERHDDWEDFERLRIEPSLLSLVCRELNNRRLVLEKKTGQPQKITAELVAGTGTLESILNEFYERSIADQPSAVRALVEDKLLTKAGFRDNLSVESAEEYLRERHADPSAINVLVNRRLLRFEERLEVRRLELAHDVLTEPVRTHREERQKQEADRQKEEAIAAAEAVKERARKERRRAQFLLAIISTAFLLAAVAAVIGFVEYRRAREATSRAKAALDEATKAKAAAEKAKVAADAAASRATHARDEAEKLIEFMTFDLRDKLEPIGRLDLLNDVNKRVRAYYDAFSGEAETPNILRRRSAVLVNQGEVQRAQGDLAGALQSYRDGVAIQEQLVRKDPSNSNWQRDLSVGYDKVGDVQAAQGDLAGALQSYRDELALAEKLARQDPANAGWQRDLSISYEKVGNVQSAQGDLAGALKSYRDGLAIREKLARQDPANAGWQRDLAVSHEKVGNVQAVQGDLAGALQSYRDGLAIAEKLARQDPANAGWQRDVAWVYWRTGSAWAKVDPKSKNEARSMVEKGRDILRQLKERTGLSADQQKWLDSIEADLRKMQKTK
jgi:tetratricopeptide (TPR) repeat protein